NRSEPVSLVADAFNVEKDVFLTNYEKKTFMEKINPNLVKKSLFNWNDLAQEMESLENDYVYGDRHYTLKDIFIFQNATFKLSGSVGWEPIDNLKSYLETFEFDRAKADNLPVVIYGDFGVGKTSFCKMFASWLIKTNHEYFPIFIPLKVLPVHSNDMEKAISKYLSGFGQFDFMQIDRKVVFLFDGFDELNLYLDDKNWITKGFAQLRSLLRYRNIYVIISSRPILFLKEEKNIPHETPLLTVQEFDQSQIKEWISKWKQIPEMEKSTISYQNLKDRKLIKIIENPLLLYMTSKIFDTELTEKKYYSKGYIYKLFYDWTIRGKFKDEQQAHDIPEPHEYRVLLQNIAMVIYQMSPSEYIRYEDLKEYIRIHQNEIKSKFERILTVEIVTVAHFFKVKEYEELKYIEFAHKSFREYLVAEKIFTFFQESYLKKDFDDLQWYTCGRIPLKKEEIQFLKDLLYTLPQDELFWLYDEIGYKILPLFSTGLMFKRLTKLECPDELKSEIVYSHSITVATLAYIVGNILYYKLSCNKNQIQLELEVAHCTSYIFHLCNSLCRSSNDKTRDSSLWPTAKLFLEGINLSKQNLDGIDFHRSNLDEAIFNDSSLKRCSFSHSLLTLTDFSYAICDGADFQSSSCIRTNFTNTYLNQVTFRDAQIFNANFTNTEFKNVDFSGSNFNGCTFENCTYLNVIADNVTVENCTNFPELNKNG
ncbi:pentapeptide repeat protein, partial [Candidatus Magnetomorum sp. HK-1]